MKDEVYKNSQYSVVLDPKDDNNNYSVVHNEFQTVESRVDNLPQALILAEQFAYILDNQQYKTMVREMYEPPSFSFGVSGDTGSH